MRAYLLLGQAPSSALANLNRVGETFVTQPFATLFVGHLQPHTGGLRYALAGHPPPLLLQPNHPSRYLEEARSVPIAAIPDARFTDTVVTLDPGATLVVYTDGLIERRRQDLDHGLARLVESASGNHDDPKSLIASTLEAMDDGP